MEITPVRRYTAPAYPTREALSTERTLLTAVPRRWLGHPRVLLALSLTYGLAVTPLRASSAEAQSDIIAVNLHEDEPVILGDVVAPEGLLFTPKPIIIQRLLSEETYTVNNTLMAPLRPVAEHLGATVTYHDGHVTVASEGTTLEVTVDSTRATLNGTPLTLPLRARLRDGQLWLPARPLAEALGGSIAWDGPAQSAIITAPQAQYPLRLKCRHHFRAQSRVSREELYAFLDWLKAEGIV